MISFCLLISITETLSMSDQEICPTDKPLELSTNPVSVIIKPGLLSGNLRMKERAPRPKNRYKHNLQWQFLPGFPSKSFQLLVEQLQTKSQWQQTPMLLKALL